GGWRVAVSGSTTPVHKTSPSPVRPSPSDPSGPQTASATPTPAVPPVPPNFAASSVTFVSTGVGWVIGQAGTPGQCGPPDPYICTSLAATGAAGKAWRGMPAPVPCAPY